MSLVGSATGRPTNNNARDKNAISGCFTSKYLPSLV